MLGERRACDGATGKPTDAFMRILLVEDNREMAASLRRGLQEHGFAVDVTRDGGTAADFARCGTYDLIVLDRMLPGRDGLEVLRQLRELGVKTPTIFLTARGTVEERVQGLNSGADDYLVKPFSFAELVARIRVVLRRGSVGASSVLELADLRLDQATRAVERAGARIELSAKQFALLRYLMLHAGEVVSRTMILEHVWDFEFDGMTNVVDVHINRLRNKIDRGYDQPLIHTLRGVGYVIRSDA